MARFYGTIQGARGEATRLGGTASGMTATAASWRGRICVRAYADRPRNDGEVDCVRISAEQHGNSRNPTGTFFDGTFEELGQLIDWWQRRDQINAVLALLPDAGTKSHELPWCDMKVAFGIDDAEALWDQLDQLQLPAGWTLKETDCSGARCVAIFRIEGAASPSDGAKVAQQLARLTETKEQR